MNYTIKVVYKSFISLLIVLDNSLHLQKKPLQLILKNKLKLFQFWFQA
jgi:hypothetical protein